VIREKVLHSGKSKKQEYSEYNSVFKHSAFKKKNKIFPEKSQAAFRGSIA